MTTFAKVWRLFFNILLSEKTGNEKLKAKLEKYPSTENVTCLRILRDCRRLQNADHRRSRLTMPKQYNSSHCELGPPVCRLGTKYRLQTTMSVQNADWIKSVKYVIKCHSISYPVPRNRFLSFFTYCGIFLARFIGGSIVFFRTIPSIFNWRFTKLPLIWSMWK